MIIKVAGPGDYFEKYRGIIRTGDIIMYRGEGVFGRLVRMWTGETYSHIGVAYVEYGRIFLIEAQDGVGVVKRPLSETGEFYILKHDIEFTDYMSTLAHSKIGEKYSYLDAVLAGLGLGTIDNNRWQCAEFIRHVFGLPSDINTPGKIVDYLSENHSVYKDEYEAINA